ncbi:hypothetical protein HBNCFIEN_03491 (plasmid) [Legionella sp. PC997]|nr:hypothetical protein HBNCFIEN_03491 [Legionella sp. PC997]
MKEKIESGYIFLDIKHPLAGLGSNGTANRLKAFLLFLMALTHHVLPHLAWQRNIVRAY